MKETERTKIAIIYDFDGTLAPGNMQEHGFLDTLGISPKDFWQEVTKISNDHNADGILIYMMLMIKKAYEKQIPLKRDDFQNFGKRIHFYNGVTLWFDRINTYAQLKGMEIEHYIISSGNKEIIEGTPIAKEFKEIFASTYKYDHNGIPEYPAVAINYTTKTQFLFRINKGVMDISDNKKINEVTTNYHIPFSNMIFIGDGETDIPCFKLTKEKGGYAIAVYDSNIEGAKEKGKKLIDDKRVHCAFQADYSEGKSLDITVKTIIDKMEVEARINNLTKNDL